jgi:hypothetical protein
MFSKNIKTNLSLINSQKLFDALQTPPLKDILWNIVRCRIPPTPPLGGVPLKAPSKNVHGKSLLIASSVSYLMLCFS